MPRPRLLALALLAAFQAQWMPVAWSLAPSQKPLVSKDIQPPPNVMLTLDTSWSMIFPYIPEGSFNLPGGSVLFPSGTSVILHPDDNRFDRAGYRPWDGDGGVITGDSAYNAPVLQLQMRSPDVNALYYDPRILYLPWIRSFNTATQTPTRYPAALPHQAYFDPNDTSKFADLTATETTKSAYWCETAPDAAKTNHNLTCGAAPAGAYSKPFSPGLYYLLDPKNANCLTVSVKSKDPSTGDTVTTSLANPNSGACYTKYNINVDQSFPKYPNRTDCDASACTQDQERQNFANWFVYYRTRLHMAQGAVPEAFLQLENDKIRVGWATIHQGESTIDGASSNNVIAGVRNMGDERKTALTDWIRNFNSTNKTELLKEKVPQLQPSTPLRSALSGVGNYFSRNDAGSPWATNPGSSGGSSALACRRAYNVLITDGYYNDSDPNVGDVDTGTITPAPVITSPDEKSYQYKPQSPYADGYKTVAQPDGSNSQVLAGKSNKLADVAMKYWMNDLSPLDNKVPAGNDVLGQDPAFWQHLVQLPIGLGITGSVPNDSIAKTAQYVQTNGWWSATDPNVQRVDDLLHAAINSRGQYFSAKKPSELSSALTTALNRAARRDGMKQAGVATSLLTISGNNIKYVPEYTTEQWTGDLEAYGVQSDGTWSKTARWSAAARLPAAANRNIVTVTKGETSQSGVSFFWPGSNTATGATNLDATSQNLINQNLPDGASGETLVNFIRGDSSLEDSAQALHVFRQRESKLGDFVNSTPVVAQGNVNLSYDLLPKDAAPGYKDFLEQKATRTRVIYTGANDGMLHAFTDAGTTCGDSPAASTCGQEIFAYVPQAVLPKLGSLAKRDYGTPSNPHQFLVDGPLTESDAYFNGSWKNVLIGTLGAGGKAIFALDITSPAALGTASVLWEKSSEDAGTAKDDFGYMLGDAQVGMRASDKEWTVFVGNGPYSKNGRAALLMITLPSGAVTSIPTATADSGNGLGAVRLVKNSNQQVTDVYAGDLKGQLWHFDVTNASASPTLVFSAQSDRAIAQPITAAPSVMAHPRGGALITFGTGKLFDDADSDNESKQSLYGVWEKPSSDTSGTQSPATRGDLVGQEIVIDPVASTANHTYYSLTYHKVDYATQRGWYIDLTQAPGQRLIYPPSPIKNFVLFNTVAPVTTTQATTCDNNGKGFSWYVPIMMDGTYDHTIVLDTNGDGQINADDALANGYSTEGDGRGTVLTDPKCPQGSTCTPPCPPGNTCTLPCPPGTVADVHTGSLQCIKPPGAPIKRVWRRLITTPHPY